MRPIQHLRRAIAAVMIAHVNVEMAIAEAEHVASLRADLIALLPRRDRGYRRPWWRRTGKLYPSNGARERSRRMAHIAAGCIKPANGLQAA